MALGFGGSQSGSLVIRNVILGKSSIIEPTPKVSTKVSKRYTINVLGISKMLPNSESKILSTEKKGLDAQASVSCTAYLAKGATTAQRKVAIAKATSVCSTLSKNSKTIVVTTGTPTAPNRKATTSKTLRIDIVVSRWWLK